MNRQMFKTLTKMLPFKGQKQYTLFGLFSLMYWDKRTVNKLTSGVQRLRERCAKKKKKVYIHLCGETFIYYR
jgi:hypothetical protein